MDVGGLDAARPFLEYARPEHPALIDRRHMLGEVFGIVNVPSWIWIDEDGTIVRPPEPAWPGKSMLREMLKDQSFEDLHPYMKETLVETRKLKRDLSVFPAALRGWVAEGAESRFALSSSEVVARSRPRPPEVSRAAAHFELAQHLVRSGDHDAAIPHFREAHRLQPDNWTYKRQAWVMVDPLQGPTEHYEGHWVKDIRERGYEDYYPPFTP